jgi:DNA-binding NarL/FixJ family response regulator
MTTIARFPPADYDPPVDDRDPPGELRLVSSRVSPPARPRPLLRLPRNLDLSPRQRAILLMVARGLSNEEIAVEIDLSKSSVKKYVADLFRRTACRNRVALVIAAYESGLIEPGVSANS